MSSQDMKPTSDTYTKRWQAEDAGAFEAEVKAQKQYVFQDEIRGEFGKRFRVRDADRVSAFKRLCALATHPNAAEQNKRAQTIGERDLFESLCTYMKSGNDVMQYWSGLLMLQLLHQNIACCTIFLQSKGLNTIAEMIARAEVTMAKTERGENAFDDYAAFFEMPCSQHTLFVCLMIASNISHFFPESHEIIRASQEPWSFRAHGKDKSLLPPPGILTVCAAIIRRGRTLEYPTFDAAIRLVHCLSASQVNILPLMRADVSRAMSKHYEAETSEGPACKATGLNIQAFAAVMVQKHVRGHAGRNLVSHAKANRLKKFYSNFKKKTYFRGWKRFTADIRRVKTFFKGIFDRREKYGVKHSFKRWAQYTAWFREIERDAHTFFTWESTRNLLFCEWIDFLRNEVAQLNAKVQAKCKTVLVLITGEVFKNCIKEWKAMVQKTKVIKRRWLHGSKDTAMRKWKKFIADIHNKFDEAGDRLRVLCRHLSGDFASATFHEWSEVCRKKKIAVRRLFHRTLFFGWDGWLEHMDETFEVIRQVNVKCAHIVSLLSGDLFNVCFQECHRYAVRRITTRRVTSEYRTRLVSIMWRTWLRQLTSTARTAATIRERCSSIVYYISHGACVECFAMWKDRIQKRKRAIRMFTHACLIRCLHVWTNEIIPRSRTIKRAKVRMTKHLEHYFVRLWAYNVQELSRQRDTIDRIAFRMQNRCLVMCCTQWMHWTSETIYTREVVAKIRRTYEIRVAREPLEKWYNDARHSARLKRLVYRIKNRAVQLAFEEMARMVEETKLHMKEAMLEKSTLIARWLKRPMIECWDAWSAHCAELRRRDQLLKRLRYRMLNAGAVRALSEWKRMIRLNQEERRQMLFFAVSDAVKNGASSHLRATLSSHAIWNLRYDRTLMQEAMQQLFSRDLSAIPVKGRFSSTAKHGEIEGQGADVVTGTSIYACLLLVDHVQANVRVHAIRKLCDHIDLWKAPWCVMEDTPHADDIVAAVQQRFTGDTDTHVRDAAQELLTRYTAPPARSAKIDTSCLNKQHWWQRINTPITTLAALRRHRTVVGSQGTRKANDSTVPRSVVDSESEQGRAAIQLQKMHPNYATAHDDALALQLLATAAVSEEQEVAHVLRGESDTAANFERSAASPSGQVPAGRTDAGGSQEMGGSAPFVLYRETRTLSSAWDSSGYDASLGAHNVARDGAHDKAVHGQGAQGDAIMAHELGLMAQLPLTQARKRGSKKTRASRDRGLDVVKLPRGGGGRAHKWAQDFDFTSTQHSRTTSVFEVRGTLSDFESQLSRGASQHDGSRMNTAASHSRSQTSLGWIEGRGRTSSRSGASGLLESDASHTHGAEGEAFVVHDSPQRGPRTPRGAPRFSRVPCSKTLSTATSIRLPRLSSASTVQ